MPSHKDTIAASITRARSELEQALADLERLPAFEAGAVAFAAHALNNYLTVTAAVVELLQLQLVSYPDPQVPIWLDGLRQATNLMSHTVAQLMNVSESGEARLLPGKMDLVPMLRRSSAYYQRVADRKQIKIVCELPVEAAWVWADRVAVAAVLDNLLSNAVKFSAPGKQVWLEIKVEPARVVCSVRDEGPGLSPGDQARLFQKGAQLGPTPTGGEVSTGYGLAVAKDLIGKLGGEIWCESREGTGSCFSFLLPAYQEQAHGPALNRSSNRTPASA